MKVGVLRLFHWFGLGTSPLILFLVTVLSLLPSSGSTGLITWIPFGDKGAHALAYAALGFCMFCAVAVSCGDCHLVGTMGVNRWRAVAIFVLLMMIGILIEVVQPQFGRSSEWLDVFADGLGSISGIALGTMAFALGEYCELRRTD